MSPTIDKKVRQKFQKKLNDWSIIESVVRKAILRTIILLFYVHLKQYQTNLLTKPLHEESNAYTNKMVDLRLMY